MIVDAASHVDRDDGEPILSFEDLISLEVVRRFRVEGASLQGVRVVESVLREYYPDYHRPFAHEVFFTDGADVWAEVEDGDSRLVIELRGRRKHHYAWRDAVAHSRWRFISRDLNGARIDGNSARGSKLIHGLSSAQPVVADTRVKVETVGANLEVATPDEVADWYGLTTRQAEGVRDCLAAH